MGEPTDGGQGESKAVKNENGKMYYSTDGGKTWSENAPEGFEVSENGGRVTFRKK